MTEDEARAFMHDWWDGVWFEGDVDRLDRLVADTYVHHSVRGDSSMSRDELKERIVQYQRVLHAPATTVDDWALRGDTLWQRATSRGVDLEAGAARLVTWMVAHRFEQGRLAEGWVATVFDVDWSDPTP